MCLTKSWPDSRIRKWIADYHKRLTTFFKSKLKERVGPEKAKEVDAMAFGTIGNLKISIVDDVDTIKASPYLRKDLKLLGFLFDITKGTVTDAEDL